MGRSLLAICILMYGVLAASCVRDVEINLGDLPDRIVLNASVSPGKDVRAHVSKTWFIMDNVANFDLPDPKIRVYINGEFQGLMRYDDFKEEVFNTGQYVLPGCRVREGDRLRMEAEADGYEPVSGETLIPGGVKIIGVDTSTYRSSSYSSSNLRFTVEMNPASSGYYRLVIEKVTDYRKGDSTMTVTSYQSANGYLWYYTYFNLYYEDPVFQTFEGSPITSQIDGRYCMGVFAGKDMISGNTLRVSVSPVDYSYESDTLSSKVHYDVHLLSISEDYYRYMKIMRGYSITIGDANFGALIAPADTYSNVENGFGIVAGYQEDKLRITMRRDTVPPSWNPWDGYSVQ